MENLSKKAGYLKGLLEGANLEAEAPNGKLLSGVVELLGALCERVESMDELMEDLNDYVQSIDDDLTELENDYDGFDEDDMDEDDLPFDDDEGVGAFPADNLRLLESDGTDPEEGPLMGRICPECKGLFFTAIEDGEEAEYLCPHCGKRVRPAPLVPCSVPVIRPVEK